MPKSDGWIKPGEVRNPKGRPRGPTWPNVSPNASLRKFAGMSPDKLRRLQAHVQKAMAGKCEFPYMMKTALDLQMFIAFMSSLNPKNWKDAQFVTERLEPSKQMIEMNSRVEEVGKIEIEIVGNPPNADNKAEAPQDTK